MLNIKSVNGKLELYKDGELIVLKTTKIMSSNGLYVTTNQGDGILREINDTIYISDPLGNLIEIG